MNFTKEEVSLCKQIAKKHRKNIVEGDWLLKDEEIGLVQDIKIDSVFNEWLIILLIESEEVLGSGCVRQNDPDVTPFWTISDCLEFLREKGFRYNLEDYRINPKDLVSIFISGGKNSACRLTRAGKTPLEACLKAVLVVLEEGK